MAFPDAVAGAPVVLIDMVSADVLRVSVQPPIGGIDRRFVGREAFTEALRLAINAAAGLGYRLADRTGRLSEAECAALVANQAGQGGAEIVTLASWRRYPSR